MLYLTRSQVREIDRRSIAEYHIPGIVLMENAGRGRRRTWRVTCWIGVREGGPDPLRRRKQRRRRTGDARHLHNRGADVSRR